MRAVLDRLYRAALWLAAFCLLAIALMVAVQIFGRIVDGVLHLFGVAPLGIVVLSLAEIAGNLLAAASFLALAGTLTAGTHIRVTMLLSALGPRGRRLVEAWAFGFAAAFCGYMTWCLAVFALVSLRFHEVSPGVIPVPLALPQAAMALGMALLTVALVDEFVVVLMHGRPRFAAAEEALTLGKEG